MRQVLDPQAAAPRRRMFDLVFKDHQGFFRAGNKEELQLNGKIVYKEYYEIVRRVCAKERLLEFDMKEGWAPLCPFLGKEPPKGGVGEVVEGVSEEESVEYFEESGLDCGYCRSGYVCGCLV